MAAHRAQPLTRPPPSTASTPPNSTSSSAAKFHTEQQLDQRQQQQQAQQHGVTSRRALLTGAAAAATAGSLLLLPSSASAAAVSGRPAPSSSPLGFESRVTEFTLSNGLHFIVLPRRDAPVVACHTYANVGAWNEEDGSTGLAHLLEHMAFKGTPRVGTTDFAREAPLLDAADEAFYELREARAASASSRTLTALRSRLRGAQEAADALVVPNEYGAVLSREGAVGLNATTSQDQTRYFLSLPSNKLELWMALEAERFRAPVFRQLYSEKTVIEEERRLRVDNSPTGRYQQEYALTSLANNYRRPIIGFEGDFDAVGRREVQAFFNRYYGPANLTIAIVGDADPLAVQRLAERYWGGWAGPAGYTVLPRGSELQRPARGAARSVDVGGRPAEALFGEGELDPRPEAFVSGSTTTLRAPARGGPAALLGYYRPPLTSWEGVVLEVVADVLSGSRTSRFVRELVLRGQVLSADVVAGYPGERHAGMALVYGVPKAGDSPEAAGRLLQQQLAALCDGGVREAELARVQRSSRVGLLSAAQSNSAMAGALASYHVNTGSWRGLVRELEAVTALRPGDVQDVAQRVFGAGCFEGYVLKA